MLRRQPQNDYQPVTRSRLPKVSEPGHSLVDVWPVKPEGDTPNGPRRLEQQASIAQLSEPAAKQKNLEATFLKHGHAFSYAALFLFTVILYARPAEFYPSALTASIALLVGIATLGFFVPTQLSLEGTLTARPREVNLALLFCLTGLLSVAFAINREEAWAEFSGTFIRCIVIFVVIVNVVRTEARLKSLLLLALASGIWLSVGAINDYRLGLMTVEGYRAGGAGHGIFGNPNDMALHLVTLVPIAIAFLLRSRKLAVKFLCGVGAVLMTAAIMLTYSRGAFIGLVVAVMFMGWKVTSKHRLAFMIGSLVVFAGLLAIAPGGYTLRLASILVPGLDPVGSADARRGELFRSLYVALRHPILGIGMGNYAPEMSYIAHVTHNSYTQVAAEMGMTALACYTMFIVSPLRKLGQIARETFDARTNSQFYYLAVGLQATLLGYMVSSFFASVPYLWYVFYLVGYAVCLRRLYEAETGKVVVLENRKERQSSDVHDAAPISEGRTTATI